MVEAGGVELNLSLIMDNYLLILRFSEMR